MPTKEYIKIRQESIKSSAEIEAGIDVCYKLFTGKGLNKIGVESKALSVAIIFIDLNNLISNRNMALSVNNKSNIFDRLIMAHMYEINERLKTVFGKEDWDFFESIDFVKNKELKSTFKIFNATIVGLGLTNDERNYAVHGTMDFTEHYNFRKSIGEKNLDSAIAIIRPLIIMIPNNIVGMLTMKMA